MIKDIKLQEQELNLGLPRLKSGFNNGFINCKNGLFTFHKGKCYRLTYEYCINDKIIKKAERIAEQGTSFNDYPLISCEVLE
jgi:hypothetical protein